MLDWNFCRTRTHIFDKQWDITKRM